MKHSSENMPKGVSLNLTRRTNHSRWRWMLIVGAALGLNACVTINIYFPAAAAEKAADKVIDEIWQTPASKTPGSDQPAVPATSPTAAPAAN